MNRKGSDGKTCPVAQYCGGCQLQGFSYADQLEAKQKKIEELLNRFHKVERIIGMNDPYHYRNKIQVTFGYDNRHNVICGNYVQGTHQIVEIKECMICDEKANQIIGTIKDLIMKYHISVFDERAMKGCVRHVMIRCSGTGEYMVILVTGSPSIRNGEQLVKDLLKRHPEIKTVVQNINSRHTSMILGSKNRTLYGKGYITDELCGLKFRISPSSFYQVNKRQTEILYAEAIKAAELKGNEVLIDAYCGTGTIGLCASKSVRKVLGVELNRSAVKDALINKKLNHIENAEFICEDAGKYMEYLAKQKIHVDVVIMDPPRTGSDRKFMSSVFALNPEKVVYVSCNPATLKDDLNYLTRNYTIRKMQPVDMFPFTEHIETVCLLYRQSKQLIPAPRN
ncbi:MAG: 23S rRNA (uracil(1939)-C(5))-methyltransferase RlmD [Erysipelotrichaceae bacterium]|nr:23S rRNA (uracil(1939)-C(5))-methyltransferase RlmD [Erysipelotrichaceae bacterium]